MLWSVHSFGTLNTSHTILCRLAAHSTHISNPRIISTILLDLSWSVIIFVWNFRAISFKSHHSTTDSHNSRLNISIALSIKILTSIDTLSIRNLTSLHILSLICKSSSHHIGLCTNILTTHYNVVFFDNSYTSDVMVWILLRVILSSVVLLCLNNMTTMHLWIFNFNLRVVEYVIVVVYIFNDFYRLLVVLTFLLWFGWASSSLMRSTAMMASLRWPMTLVRMISHLMVLITLMTLISR